MLDTANINAIRRAIDLYPVSGVTTNPSIIAIEGRPVSEVLSNIRELIGPDLMLHAQVLGSTAEVMIQEALLLVNKIDSRLIIKIPVTQEGIKAIRTLSKKNVRVTATAIFTPQQALMAAISGAEFLAPYINRLDNICGDGIGVVSEIVRLIDAYALSSKVLAASFKNLQQIHEVSMMGVHSVTMPPELFDLLLDHPLTDLSISSFVTDWEDVYGKGKNLLDLLEG